MKYSKTFDLGSLAIIVLTLVLFVLAVFVKGLSKELLLEAGVFLVSVKLIMQSYKISANEEKLMAKLEGIEEALARIERRSKE